MGFVQNGVVAGANLAINGLTPAGLVAQGDIIYRRTIEPPPSIDLSNRLVTLFTPGPLRRDYTGAVGMRFWLTEPMTFSKIGGMCGSGVLSPQTIALRNASGNAEIARVIIDMAGKTLGQWYWADIPEIRLTAGPGYVLWAQVNEDDDYLWADNAGPNTSQIRNNDGMFATWGLSLDSAAGTADANAQFWGVDLA